MPVPSTVRSALRRLALATSTLLAMTLVGLTSAQNTQPAGTLLAYTELREDGARPIVQAFERRYPNVTVELVRVAGRAALSRIRAEREEPQADVWWGGEPDTFTAAAAEGLLEPYVSPEAARIDPRFRSEDGAWTGFSVDVLGFVLNEGALEALAAAAPTSWADLLRPEFRDRVVMANPGTSRTAFGVLATLVQLMGEEEAFAYLRELHRNVQQYPTSTTAVAQMAGLGEVAIGVDFGYSATRLQAQGRPVVVAYPSEGSGFAIGAVALIAGAPDPELAKLFIDFVLSAEGQMLGQHSGAFQLPTHDDAASAAGTLTLAQAVLIEYDFAWAAENRQRLVARWNDEVATAPR